MTPMVERYGTKLLRKVPEVTVYFWLIKLLTTAMGESTSDYLINTFNPYLSVIACFVVFVVVLGLQFKTRKYIPWVYWLTVLMVAVFGTMAADVTHVVLGVPYLISTLSFAVVLAIVFVLWKKSEGTLSIHSVYTTRREVFYWATVLSTFALGTAAGDLTAYTAHLGFFAAGVLFAAIFVLPVVGYWLFRLNSIATFWTAYILTRPLGASFADWTGKAHGAGGLGWGDGPVAAVLAIGIIILVVYLQISHEDVEAGPLQETASTDN